MKKPDSIVCACYTFIACLIVGVCVFIYACSQLPTTPTSLVPPNPSNPPYTVHGVGYPPSRFQYQVCGKLCAKSGGLDRIDTFANVHSESSYCVCKDKTMVEYSFHRIGD